jgi:hypothetical protein
VLTRYFVEKARDFKAMSADLIRHREMLRNGDEPIFLHEDHPKHVYMAQMKFKAAKATYRKYRQSDMPYDDINIQLIRQHMSDYMHYYHNILPQLDMLAAHHNISFSDQALCPGDDLALLRSEGARQRSSARIDQELRSQLMDTSVYVANQTAVQTQGLQRRYDHQERTLTTRDKELERFQETNRRETTRRRDIKEELGTLAEDLRLANLENQSHRTRQTQERPEQSDPGGGDRA